MGLAASQARLLFLTSRKSDVEFGAMKIAHQKIALSRDLSDLSTDYNNSLNATKLVWNTDSGSEVDLSYNLLMKPNAYNDLPYMVTDASGRAVLDETYAQAMGGGASGTASSASRDEFIDALMGDGVAAAYRVAVSASSVGSTITTGSTSSSTSGSTTTEYAKLSDILAVGTIDGANMKEGSDTIKIREGVTIGKAAKANQTWAQLYNDNAMIYFDTDGGESGVKTQFTNMLTDLYNDLSGTLSNSTALSTAYTNTLKQFTDACDNLGPSPINLNVATYETNALVANNSSSSYAVNAKNLIDSFMTYYQRAIDGESASQFYIKDWTDESNYVTSANGVNTVFGVNSGTVNTDDDSTTDTDTNTNTNTDTSNEDSTIRAYVNYYDYVYQGIQQKGNWVRDTSVSNQTYLQNTIKNGKYYVEQLSSGKWSKEAFGLNTSINEVSDSDGRAEAQSNYETEKAKLNTKEEMLDLEMQNLETERSAIETELDSVNEIIKKNIERSFKLFNA